MKEQKFEKWQKKWILTLSSRASTAIRTKRAWCRRRRVTISHRQPLPPIGAFRSRWACLHTPILTCIRREPLRTLPTMPASQLPANRSTMAPTTKIARRRWRTRQRMARTAPRPTAPTPRPTRTATRMFGTPLAAMARKTPHLFVHRLARQTHASAATSTHRAVVPWAEAARQPLPAPGTLNARSAHQRHNQPHQRVYTRITRSIHGWQLQVSSQLLYYVSRCCTLLCCCEHWKWNKKKQSKEREKISITTRTWCDMRIKKEASTREEECEPHNAERNESSENLSLCASEEGVLTISFLIIIIPW